MAKKTMKKFITALLVLALILSMAVPAFAVTPKLEVPKIPAVPKFKVEFKLPDTVWDNWFVSCPIKWWRTVMRHFN